MTMMVMIHHHHHHHDHHHHHRHHSHQRLTMEGGSDKIIIIIMIVIIIRSHVAQAEDAVVFVVLCAVSVLLSTSLGIESDSVLTSWLNSGFA